MPIPLCPFVNNPGWPLFLQPIFGSGLEQLVCDVGL